MKLAILFVALICGASAAAAVQSPLAKRKYQFYSQIDFSVSSLALLCFVVLPPPNHPPDEELLFRKSSRPIFIFN